MMKFDPSHLPLIGLITDKVNNLYESLPSIYKAIGAFGMVVGLYVGLTNQNVRQDERLETMNHQIMDIRAVLNDAQHERHSNERSIQKLTVKQAQCQERLEAMKQMISRHLDRQK